MTRPAFRPIPAPLTVDDAALDQINQTLGVPALVKPAAPPPARQETAQDAPKPTARTPPAASATDASGTKKPALAAELPAPIERFHVELPGYLTDAMRLEAARSRTTMRHLVLKGLAAIGFDIAPADLVPDVRRKSANV